MSLEYLPFIESRPHTWSVSNGWNTSVYDTGAASASTQAEHVSGWDSQTYSIAPSPAGDSWGPDYETGTGAGIVASQGMYAAVDDSTMA